MKKFITILAAGAIIAGCLAGCGANLGQNATASLSESSDNKEASGEAGDDRIEIVTTIFPEYDWVKAILGDNPGNAEVTMLLDNGVDLHSYQPTTEDMLKISSCDMFVYVGGESDEWVEDALAVAKNKDIQVVNLLEVLGDSVKEEEVVEGMEHGHDHDKEDEEREHEHEEGEVEYDEHVWLSLRNSALLVGSIEKSIEIIDAANADVYRANADALVSKLNALDKKYEETVSTATVNTILFGDRFPFRYMADDYGLNYFAAFMGCSAETEASFETIVFLADKVDELSLKAVLTIEGSDKKIAETIVENTKSKDQQILTMDSMQSVTSKDVEAGVNYLSIMESNLEVLKEALK